MGIRVAKDEPFDSSWDRTIDIAKAVRIELACSKLGTITVIRDGETYRRCEQAGTEPQLPAG